MMAPFRSAGHALRRRARLRAAADLSRPRRALVDALRRACRDQRYNEIDDVTRVRPAAHWYCKRVTLDVNALSSTGAEVVGSLSAVRDGQAFVSGGMRNQFALADLKMNRLLGTFDESAGPTSRRPDPAGTLRSDTAPASPSEAQASGRGSSVQSSGRRGFGRLQLARRARDRSRRAPAARRRRRRCARPVCPRAAGPRRRKSTFIYGAEDDARELSQSSGYAGKGAKLVTASDSFFISSLSARWSC